jgi:hypothetical protein
VRRAPALAPALAVALAALVPACLDAGLSTCGDLICPLGTRCSNDGTHCIGAGQADVCANLPRGAPCDAPGVTGGVCDKGACVNSHCGDGIHDRRTEACDCGDGTISPSLLPPECGGAPNGLGVHSPCNPTCTSDLTCGNGFLDGDREDCDCGDGSAPPPSGCNGPNSQAPSATCRLDCRRARCGDGVRSGDEVCDCGDGTVPASSPDCNALPNGLAFDSPCNSTCTSSLRCGNGFLDADREGCDCGDGTVPLPSGCSGPNSQDPNASCRANCTIPGCGDGVRSGIEDCEPTLPLGATCDTLGFYGGTLGCNQFCRFDTTACGGRCGDGMRNGLEKCDGADLAGETCASLGFYDNTPVLACTPICTFDTSLCTGFCGDLVPNGNEVCDGAPPTGKTCLDFGLDFGALGCSPICAPDLAPCRDDGWQLAYSAPGGLHALFGFGPNDVWAVGESSSGSLVVHWDGTAWTDVSAASAVSSPLFGLWGAAPDDIWTTSSGQMIHYDGMYWWSDPAWAVPTAVAAIWGASTNDVWGVGGGLVNQGQIVHWDGAAWTDVTPIDATDFLHAVWGSSASDVWAVGDRGAVWHYDGASWISVGPLPTNARLTAVWGTSAHDVWAAGPAVYHFDGTSWSTVDANAGTALGGSGPKDAWTSGSANATLRHFDGRAWNAVSGPVLSVFWASGANDVWAIAPLSGLVYHNSGQTRVPPSTQASAVWAVADDEIWTVGAGGAITSSKTGPAASPTMNALSGVWASGPNDVWAVGAVSTLVHYDGATWTAATSPRISTLKAVWGSGPNDVWAVGVRKSPFFFFEDFFHFDGTSWAIKTPASLPHGTPLSVWGSSRSDVWIADGNMLWHSSDGNTFARAATPPGLATVWGTASDDVWAGGAGGLHHFDGEAWTAVPLPANVTTIVSIWGTGPRDVWVGESSGRVFVFDGTQWSAVKSPTAGAQPAAAGTARHVYLWGTPAIDRAVQWHCRPSEIDCGDAVDDDCDGKIDEQDPDCSAAIALGEVSADGPRYIEIANRATQAASLSGVSLAWQFACDAAPRRYTFMPDAVVGAGRAFRVVDDPADVRERERYAGQASCAAPTDGGWVALCSGPCDLAACSNFLDYFAASGATAPAGAPSCAQFSPAPLDVTAIPAGSSATRAAFTGTRTTGAASDWALQPLTRD